MHLTNYSINKYSKNFTRDEETGSKRFVAMTSCIMPPLPSKSCMFEARLSSRPSSRKLSTLNKILESNCYNTEKMWNDIEDLIIKTLISAHPILKHNYHTCFPNHVTASACFEILGFDVLLDQQLRPWLLEVEHCAEMNATIRLQYLCRGVCLSGESLPKLYHRLTAGLRGEGLVTVRHARSHQPGRLQPPQDQQGGATQDEGAAAAGPVQRGQVCHITPTVVSMDLNRRKSARKKFFINKEGE